MTTKICSKCKVEKPLEDFYPQAGRNGRRASCKECVKEHSTERYANNKDAIKAEVAKWRVENPEKVKGYSAKWYAANREKAIAKTRKWRVENPEKVKGYSAKGLEKKRVSADKGGGL